LGPTVDTQIATGFEAVHLVASFNDPASTVTIGDLTGTSVTEVMLNSAVLGFSIATMTSAFAGTVTINGTGNSDTIEVGNETVPYFGTLPTVFLPWGVVRIDDDTDPVAFAALRINGLAGNDSIKVDPASSLGTTPIVLDGGAGDDFLSADATLIG